MRISKPGTLCFITWLACLLLFMLATSQANEKQPDFPHPWQKVKPIDSKTVNKYIIHLAPIIAMPDQELAALIPARRPVDGDLTQLDEDLTGKVQWYPDKSNYIAVNGLRFIPEVKFPPIGIDKVQGTDGRIWDYEYVIGRNGKKIYITSIRDAASRDWLRNAAYKLAQLYTATGKELYARKAAVIVSSFAKRMPHYVIYGKPSSKGEYAFYAQEPFPVHSGRWGDWYLLELSFIEPLVLAHDLILPSAALQQLSLEWGQDVKNEIETFLIDYCALIQNYDRWHAKNTSQRTYNHHPTKCRGMIAIGRTLEKPELIHYAFAYISEMIHKRFGLDGVFPESPSYHQLVMANLTVAFKYLEGYKDPPGYINARTNRRFNGFDADAEFPILEKAKRFLEECSFPDGTPMGVHDTYITRLKKKFKKRHTTTSRIWPSFGHAILGRGRGENQMEAHLDFGFDFSHRHEDTLNLILWAYGEELLADIGYTYTYRGWATNTLAHNLVVVDGMVQKSGNLDIETPEKAIGGRILTWAPMENGFGVIEAEDINSYPQCAAYRRSIMVVESDPAHAFVIDIFEVAGGQRHDYMAHGSADKDQTLTFDSSVKAYSDSLADDGKIKIPRITKDLWGASYKRQDFDKYGTKSQYWGNIRSIKKLSAPGPWIGTFKGKNKKDSGLRMHLLAPTDCKVYYGEAPSIRRANEVPREMEKYMMPIFTARRSGQNLVSRYVVIWEPFADHAWLDAAKLKYNSDNGIIISAEAFSTQYTIFWAPKGKSPIVYNDVKFDGRFAMIRQQKAQIDITGVDIGIIQSGDLIIKDQKETILNVLDAGTDQKWDYLKVSEANIAGIKEGWGILLFPNGHTRAIQLSPTQNRSIIRCPEGHGLSFNETKSIWNEKFSPGRSFTGNLRLCLINRLYKEAVDVRSRVK